ncbi:MAG: sulfotransferase [Pirellulaceae bacterium]|nr:sulfotransferase [Planctomycetales bacterium]
MSLRNQFIKHVGPGGMSGCTLREWLAHLRRNRFAIDPRYWPRVAMATFNSLMNSGNMRRERQFDAKVQAVDVPPPLIVLGIWRSGTTHLHNLLAKDNRYAYPNTYQALFPNTFLTTEEKSAPLLDNFMTPRRPMDNVVQGSAQPQEDEFALVPAGLSYVCGFAFPKTGKDYWRFLTLRNATADERGQWKAKWLWFLKKLTFKYQRPLVLKSPGHTGRIKLLLEIFPNAKFVHIRRNPYDVFRSAIHAGRKVSPYWIFQRYQQDQSALLDAHVDVYDAFVEERELIPAANLCEIAFEDLDASPLETIRHIYEHLSLSRFGESERTLTDYLTSIQGYRKNSFSELPSATKRQLSQRLSQCFEVWGYN